MTIRTYEALIFDFDGTMIDSDEALVLAFVELGVPREAVTFGHAIGEELARLGLTLDEYEAAYDVLASHPFEGVDEVVSQLGRWSLCSNKHPRSARAELERLGWQPEVALFAEDFGWEHKRIAPVLEQMGLEPGDIALIGDSDGDLRCAHDVGCDMYWAGWNPRVPRDTDHGVVLTRPAQLLELYG